MTMNKRFILVNRPEGLPKDSDFELREEPMPTIEAGELLLRNQYASIDPAIRGWLDDVPSYLPPVALGDAVRATTISIVEESKVKGFAPGDWLISLNKLEQYSVLKPDDFTNIID
ncbi:MAG: hypothetical protein JKY59_02865, partial [Emcibacter sp.]|nr:hypothetical protein [Emcibacter sp.]